MPASGVFAERILLALVLGVAIGIERQWRQRIAGLRTNAIVAASWRVAAMENHESADDSEE